MYALEQKFYCFCCCCCFCCCLVAFVAVVIVFLLLVCFFPSFDVQLGHFISIIDQKSFVQYRRTGHWPRIYRPTCAEEFVVVWCVLAACLQPTRSIVESSLIRIFQCAYVWICFRLFARLLSSLFSVCLLFPCFSCEISFASLSNRSF